MTAYGTTGGRYTPPVPLSSTPAGRWAQSPRSRLPPPEWSEQESASYLNAFERIRKATAGSRSERGPLRLAFLGQQSRFGPAAISSGVRGLESRFVDYVGESDPLRALSEIRSFAPHVVIALRPETLGEVLVGVDSAVKVGVFTDPIAVSGYEGHPPLQRRLRDVIAMDPRSCDYYIGYNPRFVETWSAMVPIMCCMALPVCDDVYCPPTEARVPDTSTGIFIGPVTERHGRFLMDMKRDYDWTVIDHGLPSDLDAYSIGLNLHEREVPDFEHRVSLHLARGQLVLTEPLTPEYDLQEAIHLLNFSEPIQAIDLLQQIAADPPRFRRVAIRGRLAADALRASRAWTHRLVDIASSI